MLPGTLCGLLFLLSDAAAHASEPWADPHLPEANRAGLFCWLDASRQNAARQARGLPLLQVQVAVDVCFDGSGQQRHFVQSVRDAQPTFQILDAGASIRFDGKTQFLTSSHQQAPLKEMTVFLVAAVNSNQGYFRSFLATHALNRNDYQTGLNIDLGGQASANWNVLNVEGSGSVGQRNLLNQPLSFAQFTRLCLSTKEGAAGATLFVNGQPAGKRDRAPGTIRAEEWMLGARIYSNEPRPPYAQGFLDGEIAEVLIYDRTLSDAERQAVDRYLEAKYRQVKPSIQIELGPNRVRLETVAKPPAVQMLVPGFSVQELPLDLPNINNIRYRPDRKLVALAYDGTIYLLSGNNGDGLENKATVFWHGKGKLRSPIGMALTPPGYPLGQGVFVASKGKLSLIVDTDGDDKADKEIVIAQGWQDLPHGVDLLGVAMDAEGGVYFGFGCADYTNAYQVDSAGKSHYDLKSERGTIVRVSPDFKQREIIATGIRFSVGLAFNNHGDLFATDQEGATWLNNGNPLDELLHIQRGRHYGFPPRHPKHLPNVIDEPSVFDYGPQHQSTCGLCFNGSKPGEPAFGPESWRGDALITGYSRGKLYRTQLIKTSAGYVARNHLLACLQMLAVDCCVTPQGHLLVSCHSGPPDWGTGPGGKGKLFQIRYDDRDAPQPVQVGTTGSREVRIAFNKPLDVTQLRDLSKQVKIEYGTYVYPGDRFETLRPGYAAVQQQLVTPRFTLPIYSVGLSPDQRSIILSAATHPQAERYVVTLPRIGAASAEANAITQQPTIDLAYDLNGVAVEWKGKKETWSGVWPHLSTQLAQTWTKECSDCVSPLLEQPGELTLRTQLDLWQMLRPALQPGTTLDHTLPTEQVTLLLQSNQPLEAQCPGSKIEKSTGKSLRHAVELQMTPKEDHWLPLQVRVKTGAEPLRLEVSYFTNEDPRPRALPLHRLRLPWASPKRSNEDTASLAPTHPELAKGNWSRGRALFLGEATCSKCHMARGEGNKIGPDLSNLVFRDYDSVKRDISFPSATINPDYVTYTVVLQDGRTLTGLIQASANNHFTLTDSETKTFTFGKEEIEEMVVSKVSVMPEGLDKQLGPEKLTDLMTFLLMQPPAPARLEIEGAPPPRTLEEVQAILKQSVPMTGRTRPLRVLLSAGPKDHGPGEHDYPLWQRRWLQILSMAEGVSVDAVQGWPSAAVLAKTDLLVCYSNNPGWSAARAKELDAYLTRGGGLVLIHFAVDGHKDVEEYARQIGLAWRGGASKFRHGALQLAFPDPQHPITRGFSSLSLVDESYWNLAGSEKDVHLLATGSEEGGQRPLLWTKEQGKGRVFVSIPGHYTWSFDDPLFRLLLLRGMAWSAGEPVERFESLAKVGARMSEGKKP